MKKTAGKITRFLIEMIKVLLFYTYWIITHIQNLTILSIIPNKFIIRKIRFL